ncbi:hypothetical protein ACQ4LE_009492 [Meloidogyne hapla]
MEKTNNSNPLLPVNNNTTTNPSNLVLKQEQLDCLSNQLKLLKIDDLDINKILKKFNTIKNEPKDYQDFDNQQQPFVGTSGLLEFALTQVLSCGYGHVLSFDLNKRSNRHNKRTGRINKNQSLSNIMTSNSLKTKVIDSHKSLINLISKKSDLIDKTMLDKLIEQDEKLLEYCVFKKEDAPPPPKKIKK